MFCKARASPLLSTYASPSDRFVAVYNEHAAPFEWKKETVHAVKPAHKYADLSTSPSFRSGERLLRGVVRFERAVATVAAYQLFAIGKDDERRHAAEDAQNVTRR